VLSPLHQICFKLYLFPVIGVLRVVRSVVYDVVFGVFMLWKLTGMMSAICVLFIALHGFMPPIVLMVVYEVKTVYW
jgi:hypothetical protein